MAVKLICAAIGWKSHRGDRAARQFIADLQTGARGTDQGTHRGRRTRPGCGRSEFRSMVRATLHDCLEGSERQPRSGYSGHPNGLARPGSNPASTPKSTPARCIQLDEVFNEIVAAGAKYWQVQLTVAMGNAVDNSAILLQPHQIVTVVDKLAELYHRGTGGRPSPAAWQQHRILRPCSHPSD